LYIKEIFFILEKTAKFEFSPHTKKRKRIFSKKRKALKESSREEKAIQWKEIFRRKAAVNLKNQLVV